MGVLQTPQMKKISGVRITWKQQTPWPCYCHHIFILHPKTITCFINKWFNSHNHSGFLLPVHWAPPIGILAKVLTNPVPDKSNSWHLKFCNRLKISPINLSWARSRPCKPNQAFCGVRQNLPNSFSMSRRLFDCRSATNPSMRTINDRKISTLQISLSYKSLLVGPTFSNLLRSPSAMIMNLKSSLPRE